MNGDSITPKKEGEISRVFYNLEKSIEKLDSIVISFDSVLLSVVRGNIPTAKTDSEKVQEFSSKLAQDLDSINMRVDCMVNKLIDLRDRIEL
jgi:hypothetical protein